MEQDWNRLTEQDRAEFSAWRLMKQSAADAKALSEAEAAAAPKKYDAMTEAEKRVWLRQQGIPVQPWAKP